MRITEAIRVDHEFRHYRRTKTLQQTINYRLQWYKINTPDALNAGHERRAQEVLAALKREEQRDTLAWEINTSISRHPLLKIPTAEIMDYIFPRLAKPRPVELSPIQQSITEIMTMRNRDAAKNQFKALLSYEVAYRAKQKWYMIFNTLTVAPGEYYKVFQKKSKAFTTYIKKIDRLVATATHGSIRQAQDKEYHTYMAVVEEGSKHGRLHIHCLHFMKELPVGSVDPNLGRIRPDKRLLTIMQRYWPHGESKPIIVRYSPNDAFGLANYRWPIDRKTQQPMAIKSPLALATYLSKYISKGYNSCQRNKLLWRVRKSHKLGTQILDELAEQLSISTLLLIQTADNMRTKLNNSRVPQNLLRIHSLKRLQNHLSTNAIKSFTSLAQVAKQCTTRLSPLQYSRASIQTIQENNQQSTQYLSMLDLNNEATFRMAWTELYHATKKTNDKYFAHTSAIYGTASTRDHIYTSATPTS